MIAMGPVRIANDTSENQLAFMTKQDLSINEYTAYNKYKEQLSIVSPIQIQYYNHLLHISTHHTFDLSTAPILVEPRSEISSIPVLQPERFHHSYALEKQLGQNLFTDNIQVLENIAEIFSAYPKPILAHNNPLRSEKNFFISTVNVYARFAIEAGLSAETAFSYCDYFIQEAEVLSNIGNVEQLTFRMISTYKNLVKEHKNATFSNPVSLSMDYIDKHITDNITLSDVARTIGYSSKYLSEVFAKETDTTFKSYVMDKKLEVAKSLLLNPKNSILDICDYLGFCNQSYFSKMFKKNTGSSPSAFIKHHR
jgi:YesN/AraC family two-component response regulator